MVDALQDLRGLALDVLAGVAGGQTAQIDRVAAHDAAAHARPGRLGDIDAADVGHGSSPLDLNGNGEGRVARALGAGKPVAGDAGLPIRLRWPALSSDVCR